MTIGTEVKVTMPRLSDSMEEGVIAAWLIADGDEVTVGQEIAEIETDKATMPYEAEATGTIRIVAAAGATVAVGDVIAVIGEDSAAGLTPDRAPALPPNHKAPSQAATPSAEPTSVLASNGAAADPARANARANASPVARRIAGEHGLDLIGLTGSGPGGRIVKADVLAAVLDGAAGRATAVPTPAPGRTPAEDSSGALKRSVPGPDDGGARGETTLQSLTRAQRLIARRMAESKTTAPEFVLEADIDMEAAVELRARLREIISESQVLPSYNDFVIKACGLALHDHPLANGTYIDEQFELHGRVNVGVAVAVPGSLVVPTVFDADRASLGEIARTTRRLAARVREGSVTPPELAGSTFAVSNLGMFGIDRFSAVINPPHAAILAVGSLKPRAVVHDGALVARQTMTVSLTCDHRILYGADAAEFLAHVRRLLEAPAALVL